MITISTISIIAAVYLLGILISIYVYGRFLSDLDHDVVCFCIPFWPIMIIAYPVMWFIFEVLFTAICYPFSYMYKLGGKHKKGNKNKQKGETK